MIVDTSVVVAVIAEEPDALSFLDAMDAAEVLRLSAGTYLEICVVLFRKQSTPLSQRFDDLLESVSKIVIEPVTFEQAKIARQAYLDYGKGSGHRANLNYGDCFSYALAKVKREPILFKGNDFMHTDLRPAV